jgi:hypothetical protein
MVVDPYKARKRYTVFGKFGSHCFCKIKKPNKNFLKLKRDWRCLYFDMTDDPTIVSYLFFPVIISSSHNWCMTDGYLRFISTVGQTTVPFFCWVVMFSGGSKNIAGQMTLPFFFSARNFFGS